MQNIDNMKDVRAMYHCLYMLLVTSLDFQYFESRSRYSFPETPQQEGATGREELWERHGDIRSYPIACSTGKGGCKRNRGSARKMADDNVHV